MRRLVNRVLRESFAAKLRNNSPEYCRVLPSENTLQSVHKNTKGISGAVSTVIISYKNWKHTAKAFVRQCWVELQHQGNTMRGLTTACVPIQIERRIARALFARQCGVELQHQRECSFKSIGFRQYTSPWRRVVFLFLRRLLVSNNEHPSILARAAVHKQWSS